MSLSLLGGFLEAGGYGEKQYGEQHNVGVIHTIYIEKN